MQVVRGNFSCLLALLACLILILILFFVARKGLAPVRLKEELGRGGGDLVYRMSNG